jgi:O-antigen/teichoic acid export membrane protein
MVRRLVGVGLTSVVTAALALVAASVLAHRLGPTGMGDYQSVVRWASIWMIFGMLGFPHASSYYAARVDESRIGRLVGNSIKTALAQSAILMMGGYLIAPYLFRSQASLVGARILLLYLPLNLVITNLAHIAIGRLNTRVFNTFRLLQAAAFLTVVAPLVMIIPTAVAPLAAVVVAAAIAVGYLLLVFYRKHELQFTGDGALLRSTAYYGIQAYPGVVGRELNLYVDQLLISVLLPIPFLGLYAAAVSAAGVISVASAAFFYLAQPEAQNSAPDAVGESSARMCRLTVASLVPLAVVLGLAMPAIVPLVYGSAFKVAVPAAQILCAAAAIDGLIAALAGVALGSGRPLLSTIAQGSAVCVEVALVIALLPTFGIAGAAVASVLSYTACAGILVIALSRGLRVSPARFLVPDRQDLRLVIEMLRRLPARRKASTDPTEAVNRP